MKAPHRSFPIGFAAFLISLLPAQGALLVYEGFNYAQADNTSIDGTATNATGLSGNYAVSNSGAAVSNYRTSGLSFGSSFFASSGGALNQRANNGGTSYAGATLNTASVSGDLWGSYLFNYDAVTSSQTTGQVRLNESATANSSTDWFGVSSDITTTTRRPAITYDGSTTEQASATYTAGTTYLLLSKYTNVGASLSAGTPGEASLWLFSQSNYEDWAADGGTEAGLDTFADATATAIATSGTFDFNQSLQSAFYSAGSTSSSAYTDEIRYGTTLGDVAAIPEPATVLMLFTGMALLVVGRRWRS